MRFKVAFVVAVLLSLTVSACSGTVRSVAPQKTALIPTCRAAELQAEGFGSDGTAGSEVLYLALTNVGIRSCVVQGWPDVRFLGADRTPVKPFATHTRHGLMGRVRRRIVTLAPHGRALFVVLVHYRGLPSRCPHAYFLRVRIPGASTTSTVAIGALTVCQRGEVTPVEPDLDDALGNMAVERNE